MGGGVWYGGGGGSAIPLRRRKRRRRRPPCGAFTANYFLEKEGRGRERVVEEGGKFS